MVSFSDCHVYIEDSLRMSLGKSGVKVHLVSPALLCTWKIATREV